MTVAELLARVSSKELTRWMIFGEIEPFGSDAAYLGHAITASTIANVNRGKGKKAYNAEDFMPKFRKKKQSTEDMVDFVAAMNTMLGGQDLRERDE